MHFVTDIRISAEDRDQNQLKSCITDVCRGAPNSHIMISMTQKKVSGKWKSNLK